jgi:hypothetical protein
MVAKKAEKMGFWTAAVKANRKDKNKVEMLA